MKTAMNEKMLMATWLVTLLILLNFQSQDGFSVTTMTFIFKLCHSLLYSPMDMAMQPVKIVAMLLHWQRQTLTYWNIVWWKHHLHQTIHSSINIITLSQSILLGNIGHKIQLSVIGKTHKKQYSLKKTWRWQFIRRESEKYYLWWWTGVGTSTKSNATI